jgi:hypothetical protein
MRRRPFLKLLGGAAFVAAGGVGGLVAWRQRRYLYRKYVRHVPDRATGALTDDELRHVLALAEVVFPPADDRQNTLLQDIVARWATARTEQDGRLPVYRGGVEALQRATGDDPNLEQSYCELSQAKRDSVVRHVMLLSENDPRGFDGRGSTLGNAALFWNRDYWRLRYLIEDLALGIYSSALGWSVVGYDTWPGVPSGPLGYTRPPPLDDTL